MNIIKLDATSSTNTYLKQISIQKPVKDYTVVTANYQTQGRGQMGTHWISEDSKNLICSVFKVGSGVLIEDQFYISMVTSLSIVKTLERFQIPKIHIKWPNDILSDSQKVCGILIENVIKSNRLEASIIGIGMNVNQTEFKNLPQATSLKKIMGITYHSEELLQTIIEYLKHYFEYLKQGQLQDIKQEYEDYLFRKDKPSTFKKNNGITFSAFIKGVTNEGLLILTLEDEVEKTYDLKEVELLY